MAVGHLRPGIRPAQSRRGWSPWASHTLWPYLHNEEAGVSDSRDEALTFLVSETRTQPTGIQPGHQVQRWPSACHRDTSPSWAGSSGQGSALCSVSGSEPSPGSTYTPISCGIPASHLTGQPRCGCGGGGSRANPTPCQPQPGGCCPARSPPHLGSSATSFRGPQGQVGVLGQASTLYPVWAPESLSVQGPGLRTPAPLGHTQDARRWARPHTRAQSHRRQTPARRCALGVTQTSRLSTPCLPVTHLLRHRLPFSADSELQSRPQRQSGDVSTPAEHLPVPPPRSHTHPTSLLKESGTHQRSNAK